MGQHLEAYQYAKRHLEISRDTKDRMGQATAQLNLADLCRYVNLICFPENVYLFLEYMASWLGNSSEIYI